MWIWVCVGLSEIFPNIIIYYRYTADFIQIDFVLPLAKNPTYSAKC